MNQWGLNLEEIESLGEKLREFWQDYASEMRTKTRDTSEYGYHYLSGLLRLEEKRTIANISRKTGQSEQNMQHFISKSPWSASDLLESLQCEMETSGIFKKGVLIIDESADAKAGKESAGAGRQYNGRLGKVDLCQVGVFASLATDRAHCWIDGELFIPEEWFEAGQKAKRKRVGIPEDKEFRTKVALAEILILRAVKRGLSFEAVDMDSLYGRSFQLRKKLQDENIEYYADIPADTLVYLAKPEVIFKTKKNGALFKKPIVLGERSKVCYLLDHPNLESDHLRLRSSERGFIEDKFSRLPVWTEKEGKVLQEWLLIRQSVGTITYVLSNASSDTPLDVMAERKSYRYLIERDNQDSKSEFGWDEFQATKYIAWEHQLALTVMAFWFVLQTRLRWDEEFGHDPALLHQYEVEALPRLSVGNVRELLRAVMPLPQLSAHEAASLVVKHLQNRTRSRKSRLRKALTAAM